LVTSHGEGLHRERCAFDRPVLLTESDAADRIVREFCAAWANKDPDELVSFFVEDPA
jgi:hypothetical protein